MSAKSVKEIVSFCQNIFEDINFSKAREWKEAAPGRKVIGYMPVYVPREIIHAAGMLPLGILGGEPTWKSFMATPTTRVTSAASPVLRIQEGDFGAINTVAVLEVIGVADDAQGKGVGRTLLFGIEEQMKKKGIITLKTQTLWTDRTMTY